MLTLTERAAQALSAADVAARRFNADARVRVRTGPAGVVTDLVEEPTVGESVRRFGDLELIVDDALTGTLDAGEHNALVLT
jgi:hypothetical protein